MREFKNGQRVRYVGPTDWDFRVRNGEVYTVFGDHPDLRTVPPSCPANFLTICVPDVGDRFGGVVGVPEDCFVEVV